MSAHIPVKLRRRIRAHFSEWCAYCRTAERLKVVTFEVDHILPAAAGGPTIFDNLCLACPMCNRHKADRTSAPDPTTGKIVSLFHPQQDVWSEHFGWSPDGSQLIGLTAAGRAATALLRMNRPHLVRTRKLWVASGEHPPPVHT